MVQKFKDENVKILMVFMESKAVGYAIAKIIKMEETYCKE